MYRNCVPVIFSKKKDAEKWMHEMYPGDKTLIAVRLLIEPHTDDETEENCET